MTWIVYVCNDMYDLSTYHNTQLLNKLTCNYTLNSEENGNTLHVHIIETLI